MTDYQKLLKDLELFTTNYRHPNSIQKLSSNDNSIIEEFHRLEKEAGPTKQIGKGLEWVSNKVKKVLDKSKKVVENVGAKAVKLQRAHIVKALGSLEKLSATGLKEIQATKNLKELEKVVASYKKSTSSMQKLSKESPEVVEALKKVKKAIEPAVNQKYRELLSSASASAPNSVKKGLKMMADGGIIAITEAASKMKAPLTIINAQVAKHPWLSMLTTGMLTWLYAGGYLSDVVPSSNEVPTQPPTKEELATANLTVQQLMGEAQKAGLIDPTQVRDFVLQRLSSSEKKSSIRSFVRRGGQGNYHCGVEFPAQSDSIKEQTRQVNLKKYGTGHYNKQPDSPQKANQPTSLNQNDLAKKMIQDPAEFAEAYNRVYNKGYTPKQIQKWWADSNTTPEKSKDTALEKSKDTGFRPTQSGKEETTPTKQELKPYEIKEGDTLSGIAQKSKIPGLTWEHLAAINKIKNPNLIFIGQKIKIPSSVGKDTPKFQGQLPSQAPKNQDPTKDQFGFPKKKPAAQQPATSNSATQQPAAQQPQPRRRV